MNDLHELMRRFSLIDGAIVGRGPKHPEVTDKTFIAYASEGIRLFLQEYPDPSNDTAYFEFLDYYGGAMILQSRLRLAIFGPAAELDDGSSWDDIRGCIKSRESGKFGGMTNTRQTYQTDVNDKGWAAIEGMLPVAQGNGRPRQYGLREIVNGIFYVVRGGIAWRLMPHDLPPWSLVYNYYWHWMKAGVFEAINAKLVELSRKTCGRRKQPSLGILDSQSVKTANGGEARGIDGNKKIMGRKRHVVTDSLGHLLAVKVTSAQVADQAGGEQVLTALSQREQGDHQQRHYRLRTILVDGAYRGIVDRAFTLFGWKLEVTNKPDGVKGFVVQAKRWVIERFHAWQGRYRRLSKDYECTTDSSQAMCYLASIHRLAAKLV